MIKVIKEACIGCGACQASMPELFDFDDDGLAEPINENYTDDMKIKLQTVIESCPTDAIIEE